MSNKGYLLTNCLYQSSYLTCLAFDLLLMNIACPDLGNFVVCTPE